MKTITKIAVAIVALGAVAQATCSTDIDMGDKAITNLGEMDISADADAKKMATAAAVEAYIQSLIDDGTLATGQ